MASLSSTEVIDLEQRVQLLRGALQKADLMNLVSTIRTESAFAHPSWTATEQARIDRTAERWHGTCLPMEVWAAPSADVGRLATTCPFGVTAQDVVDVQQHHRV